MGVLLAIGVGSVALPAGIGVWLAATAVLAALALGVPDWWRRPRPLSLRLERPAHHFHYCPECDAQWEHAGPGAACIEHWAAPCPECGGETAPLPRTA